MEEIDGYVELMAETCASRREHIRVNGEDIPIELVRQRLLKLDSEHIRYVMESLRSCTTQVVNIRVSAPMIKCKKTPREKCSFMAERRKKR